MTSRAPARGGRPEGPKEGSLPQEGGFPPARLGLALCAASPCVLPRPRRERPSFTDAETGAQSSDVPESPWEGNAGSPPHVCPATAGAPDRALEGSRGVRQPNEDGGGRTPGSGGPAAERPRPARAAGSAAAWRAWPRPFLPRRARWEPWRRSCRRRVPPPLRAEPARSVARSAVISSGPGGRGGPARRPAPGGRPSRQRKAASGRTAAPGLPRERGTAPSFRLAAPRGPLGAVVWAPDSQCRVRPGRAAAAGLVGCYVTEVA